MEEGEADGTVVDLADGPEGIIVGAMEVGPLVGKMDRDMVGTEVGAGGFRIVKSTLGLP